jgi:hypothetical protein
MDKVTLPNLSDPRALEDECSIGGELESVQGELRFSYNLRLFSANQPFLRHESARHSMMPLKTAVGEYGWISPKNNNAEMKKR